MGIRQAALLTLLLTLAPPAWSAEEVRIVPALGRPPAYYRPGAWTKLHVALDLAAPAEGTPTLAVVPSGATEPEFVCTLPPRAFPAGKQAAPLTFWIVAGATLPTLRFSLEREDGPPAAVRTVTDILAPLTPEQHLWLHVGSERGVYTALLPEAALAYESCTGLVWADHASAAPAPRQYAALAEWIATGGHALVHDPALAQKLLAAARRRGWQPPPAQRFVLPTPPDDPAAPAPVPPLVHRLGRGRLLVFDRDADPESLAYTRDRVLRKLEREALPAPPRDLRLQPARYHRLPRHWPPAPKWSATKLLRWAGAWWLCVMVLLALPALRRKRLGVPAACAVTLLFAGLVAAREPVPRFRRLRAQLSLVGETGRGGPTLDESAWLIVPFASGGEPGAATLEISFDRLPPPRPLAATPRELAHTRLRLDLDATGRGRLLVHGRAGADPVRRGTVLLFTRHTRGPALSTPAWTCLPKRTGLSLRGEERLSAPLHEAQLRTVGGRVEIQRLLVPRGGLEYADGRGDPDARARFLDWFAAEHAPSTYAAVLAGWEEPAPTRVGEEDANLGTLRLYTLPFVPMAGRR